MDIYRTFIKQCDMYVSNLKQFISRVKYKFTMVIIMVSLIFFSTIITESFTSILLNSYFQLSKVPIIETLDELIIKDKYPIATKNRTINYFHNNMLDEQNINSLLKRRQKYQNKFNHSLEGSAVLLDKKIFTDVVNGKAVLLVNTYEKEGFVELYKTYEDQFIVSDHKYLGIFGVHVTSKKGSIVKEHIFA